MQNCLQITANELEAQVQSTGNASAESDESSQTRYTGAHQRYEGCRGEPSQSGHSDIGSALTIVSMEKGDDQ